MRNNNNGAAKKQVELKVVVTNQIRLDPNEPIPINFNGNSFRYAKSKKYKPFLGSTDNLPNVLLEARLTSSSQNACIVSIAQSLVGKGIQVIGVESPNTELLNWMKSVDKYRHSFDETLVSIIDGERTFGNQFIELARGEFNGQKFLKVYLRSMFECRISADEEDANSDMEYVVISKSIAKNGSYTLEKDALKIPLWTPNILDENKVWVKLDDGAEHTMLHFKNEVSGVECYGLPSSISGLRYQILESKAAQFNIDNFDNNMILGGMLIFKSSMTQDEAQEQAREILISHIGAGKTGRIAVVASEEGIQDVQFVPFETQKEGSYNESDKRWEEKIIAANQWDSVLAGINRSSTFGNGSQYIRSIWDVKDAVLLHPLRDKLISKVVKPIVRIWSEWFGVKEVVNYEFGLQTNMPFSFMGELDPNTFFKVKEARSKAGLEPDEINGEKYLSEMRPKNSSNNNVQNNPLQEQQNPTLQDQQSK